MAKLERSINGNMNELLNRIESGILNGSMSASLEDASDFESGTARCSVRVFERYSCAGSNRVSLSVTLFQKWRRANSAFGYYCRRKSGSIFQD